MHERHIRCASRTFPHSLQKVREGTNDHILIDLGSVILVCRTLFDRKALPSGAVSILLSKGRVELSFDDPRQEILTLKLWLQPGYPFPRRISCLPR